MKFLKNPVFLKVLKRRLLVSAALFLTAYFVIHHLFPNVYQPVGAVTVSEAGERQLIRIHKNAGAGPVYGLKLKVLGKLNGTAHIRFSDPEKPEVVLRETMIGSGEIKTEYQFDWYADDCRLEYEPRSATHGLVKIEYRFQTMKSKKNEQKAL